MTTGPGLKSARFLLHEIGIFIHNGEIFDVLAMRFHGRAEATETWY